MEIQICIGSSCHLRGSQEVIRKLEELCKKNEVEATIELGGSFCMGACSKGVSICINREAIYHVKPEDVNDFFNEEILGR
ncbi:MAG: (2Fe-2S) ferredoxin domain-containing protein [Lachnospiraceae bacterium]|nr:(2Fe-2S) ferredoxin domain-containing protein [Lachnospiraceae bacterium]